MVENLRKAVEGLRVGQLMVLLQIGSMPKDLTMKNTEMCATQVLPHIRDMWSEYDDRWWPKPLEKRAEVGVSGDS